MVDFRSSNAALLAVTLFHYAIAASTSTSASSCATVLTPTNSIRPTVASGYQMALVATGLTSPRSMEFDSSGNLLVVEQEEGVASFTVEDNGGPCVRVVNRVDLVKNSNLNHGLALSQDGKTLYASSADAAYSWTYDPAARSVGPSNTTLVTGMGTSDHTTRTLLLSQKINGTLLISRGSTANVDPAAELLSSGHSQIKAFDLKNLPADGYTFNTDGIRLGWGLRNSVGVVEHPLTGGIYSVENSVDQLVRSDKDIHQDNPGEEMNFHGYLNGTEHPQGSNYGYPYCFAAWAPNDIPDNSNISVGTQFAMGTENSTIDDAFCAERTPPRLTFQAHQAPLDIKFNNSGTEAWVSFHGSWDRSNPVGYKVSVIPFENGEPLAAPDNNTAATDIFTNADNSKCPSNCFRPAGLTFDSQGRLFVSSDASGEIYVVVKDQKATSSATSTGTASTASATNTSVTDSLWIPKVAVLLSVSLTLLIIAF